MNFELTPDQAHFRDRVRSFTEDRVRPRMRGYEGPTQHLRCEVQSKLAV